MMFSYHRNNIYPQLNVDIMVLPVQNKEKIFNKFELMLVERKYESEIQNN